VRNKDVRIEKDQWIPSCALADERLVCEGGRLPPDVPAPRRRSQSRLLQKRDFAAARCLDGGATAQAESDVEDAYW
jgi:hypothetical protein